MSIRLMTAAWSADLPAGEKLVLLALADCANDEGHCWPGIKSLCVKTSKGERSLQHAIKAIVAAGHLTRRERPGRGCDYIVHPRTDVQGSPRNLCAPAECAPPHKIAQSPAKLAGKPSGTTKSHYSASEKTNFPKPDGVDDQIWFDFLTNRRKKRLANTRTAHKRLIDDLNRFSDNDWSIPRLIEHAAAKGWGGIYDPRGDRAGLSAIAGGSFEDTVLENYGHELPAER